MGAAVCRIDQQAKHLCVLCELKREKFFMSVHSCCFFLVCRNLTLLQNLTVSVRYGMKKAAERIPSDTGDQTPPGFFK